MENLETTPCKTSFVFGRALVRKLVARASTWTGISQEELLRSGRKRDTSWTRFAIALVAKESDRSLWQIAGVFGQDHSSVKHGIDRARELVEKDADFAELVRLLREEAARD